MPITLRSLHAMLNAAEPREKYPLASVARAREGFARCPGVFWETRLRNAEDRAVRIDAARAYARVFVEGASEEIAALFGVTPGAFAERLEARAAENLERDPSADESETWRNLLGSLLTTCAKRIESERPSPPSIGDALIVARAFLEAPSVETLRTLAATAHAAGAPGAAWGRIRDLVARVPRASGPVLVRAVPYGIEIAWPGARYRFGTGHADEILGIGR